MNTGKLTYIIRKTGLMHLFDYLKFVFQWLKNYPANRKFKKEHPGVALPPAYLVYESFRMNYEKYYEGGLATARWLVDHLKEFSLPAGACILDWGCGPARIIRHLPALLSGASCCGCDYNPRTIEWCRKNIPEVSFSLNNLNPPLPYAASTFDVIYGISVFTHLSEQNHARWYRELIRIAKPGGLLFFTTHGEAYKAILTNAERRDFDRGRLIIRSGVKEGHRVFAAFHPPVFMKNLFESQAVILKHIPGKPCSWGIDQDVWILRKK